MVNFFFSLFLSGKDTRYKYVVIVSSSSEAVSLASSCACSNLLQGVFLAGGLSETLWKIDLISLKRKKSVCCTPLKFLISYFSAS